VVAHCNKHARAADCCAVGSDRDLCFEPSRRLLAAQIMPALRAGGRDGPPLCCFTQVKRQLRADGSIGSLVLAR
jgi:hypothetical protein